MSIATGVLKKDVVANNDKGIPALVPFPEFPGVPMHAAYDKFDAEAQLLDVTGEHEFRAPG